MEQRLRKNEVTVSEDSPSDAKFTDIHSDEQEHMRKKSPQYLTSYVSVKLEQHSTKKRTRVNTSSWNCHEKSGECLPKKQIQYCHFITIT